MMTCHVSVNIVPSAIIYYTLHRTHQLRVHMAHIGHPILGDTLYPIPEEFQQVVRDADKIAAAAGIDIDKGNAGEAFKVESSESISTPVAAGAGAGAGACAGATNAGAASNRDAEMLELLSPLEGRVILTAADAPTQAAPRVDTKYPRLCLHALRLCFTHPASKQPITLSALTTEAHMVQAPVPVPSTSIEEK